MAQKPDKSSKSGPVKPRPQRMTAPVEPDGIIDRIKSYIPGTSATGRRISRKQQEDKRTRWLYLGMAAAGVLVAVLLIGGAVNDYYLKPNKVLASVNNVEIKRKDYWKYRSHTLIVQASQYQQIASFAEGEQQNQYLNLAQQALIDLDNTWGSTDVDDATLELMITDQVYLQSLSQAGDPVTQADIDEYVTQQFQPVDAPIVTAIPTPTLIPERAEWATQTAQAELAAAEGSPEALPGSPQPVEGTPVAVESSSTPNASPDAASPVPVTEAADGVATPEMSTADAIATTEASYDEYAAQVFPEAHMSQADYERLIIAPAVAQQRIQQQINEEVGQSAEQVHASHILVGTQELADSIYDQLLGGADFADTATEQSTDTGTAPTGGDLGWFPRGIMVAQFDDVAFSLPPGDTSEPFQTEFGWHIVNVLEHDPDRAMTDEQISQVQQSRLAAWEEDARSTMDISSDLPPTPTPFPEVFVPPPGAPSPVPQVEAPVATPMIESEATPSAATPQS